jgi:hypothetical protein
MKRILALLILTLTITAHAASPVMQFTGAYWTLKAPAKAAREAGQVNVTLNDDHTVTVQTYYNSNPAIYCTGHWSFEGNKIAFRAIWDSNPGSLYGNYMSFSGTTDGGFALGTFWLDYNGDFYKGRWQATQP